MEFVEVPIFSGIAEAWKNAEDDLIAEKLFPTIPVTAENFKADVFPYGQMAVAPNNRVGRLDPPPILDFKALQHSFMTEDYSYDAVLPNFDVDRAAQQRAGNQSSVNPETFLVEAMAAIMQLRLEVRTAEVVSNTDNYLPTQQQVLAGPSMWDNPASKPYDQIAAIRNSALTPFNVMRLSDTAWTALRSNPQIIQMARGANAAAGKISIEEVQEILEIKTILVGRGWTSTAQTQSQTRANENLVKIWGNSVSLHYFNPNIKTTEGTATPTYGYSARFGSMQAMKYFDPKMGARGGYMLRLLDQRKEIVSAKVMGYLLQNVCTAAPALTVSNVIA
jgi:hypothetical protein